MIGELTRRITFKSWGSTQDEGGGAIATLLNSYTIWAKVEPRNGRLFVGEQQALWSYDYKITFRYEKSRVAKSNQTIDYDGNRLSINSLSFENEGNRKYVVARCSTMDANVDSSSDIIGTIGTFDYYGIAHETSFTANGFAMTLPTVAQDLRGRTIIGAFKDGIEFNVLLGGAFTDPSIKQVIYDSTTGTFTWGEPFEPGEHAMIQFVGASVFSAGTVLGDNNVFAGIAGEALGGGKLVYLQAGKFYLYNADDVALADAAFGITRNAAAMNATVDVQIGGIFTEAGFGLIPDTEYFAGINGLLTDTPIYAVSTLVGIALSSDQIRIEIQQSIITV